MNDGIMSELKVGDHVPYFEGVDQGGSRITLSDFAGKRLILYFYPKDNTPGCTAQACSLRDGREQLREMGFEVLGVSPDAPKTHTGFIEKHALNFPLLADTEKTVAMAYGVWGEKKFMGRTYMGIMRTTFVIDEQGVIEKIFTKVNTKDHTAQIVEAYKE